MDTFQLTKYQDSIRLHRNPENYDIHLNNSAEGVEVVCNVIKDRYPVPSRVLVHSENGREALLYFAGKRLIIDEKFLSDYPVSLDLYE